MQNLSWWRLNTKSLIENTTAGNDSFTHVAILTFISTQASTRFGCTPLNTTSFLNFQINHKIAIGVAFQILYSSFFIRVPAQNGRRLTTTQDMVSLVMLNRGFVLSFERILKNTLKVWRVLEAWGLLAPFQPSTLSFPSSLWIKASSFGKGLLTSSLEAC